MTQSDGLLYKYEGVNLDTEVSYYYQPHKTIPDRYTLDSSADKYSGGRIKGINPSGLRISGGIGYFFFQFLKKFSFSLPNHLNSYLYPRYETKSTFQPFARTNKSGDGTVPYCSLNYCAVWKEYAAEHNLPHCQNVHITEIEGADHREMLNHPAVFDAILNLVCTKPQG